MSEVPLQHEMPVGAGEESTAKTMADTVGFLGQDVLDAINRLSTALNAASDRASKQQGQGGQKSTASHHSSNSQEMKDMYQKEGERLKELHEPTSEGNKREFLGFVAEKFVSFPQHWTYEGPVFRFRLRSGEVILSKYSDQLSIDKIITWFKEREEVHALPIRTYWNPRWIVDTLRKKIGVGRDRDRSRTMDTKEIVFLAKCFFRDLSGSFCSDYQRNPDYWGPGEEAFRHFVLSFSNLSHPLAKRSLLRPYQERPSNHILLAIQYHLNHFAPISSSGDSRACPETEGLALERQFYKLHRVSHDLTKGDDENTKQEQLFVERVVSVSLMMHETHGTFQLVTIGDTGAKHLGIDLGNPFDKQSKGLNIECNALGTAAGLSHFLIATVWIIETWNQGWTDTLDIIDNIVGFNGHHTFNDRQLETYIVDSSSSMTLSKQYFTVLQLLRTARQQIDLNLDAWEEFCGTAEEGRGFFSIEWFVLRRLSEDEETLKSWETQRSKVTQRLRTHTESLRGRIDRKTEEVKSLRDGLFNATSLREATKGMALNRAIYVFTAVTIIYTPLAFMAALWALPILNTTSAGDNTHPSTAAFVASFVIVPILTYVGCGCLAWYFTSTRSWGAFTGSLKSFFQGFPGGWSAQFSARAGKAESTQAGRETV